MTIRRVDNRGVAGPAGVRKGGGASGVSSANFAQLLDSVAGSRGVAAAEGVDAVAPVGEEGPSRQERREQLEVTEEVLDSLEGVEQGLRQGDPASSRDHLQATRDQALQTLSETPRSGEERDLLHRTAVLATVELAKSSRGDYS